MSSPAPDPAVIRSIAVTVEDVITALEMNETSGKTAVLRVMPPFSGRMRARLHVEGTADYAPGDPPVHIPPDRLVTGPPSYPRPAETEDTLRSHPDEEYTVDRHHEWHRQAVADWRTAVADRIRGTATINTDAGTQEVSVSALGDSPKPTENGG